MADMNTSRDPYKKIEEVWDKNEASKTTAEEQTATLDKASQAAYEQTKLENQKAQNQFAQNQTAQQMTALDAIRKSNASAIANGANAGLSAANQLSAILGLQDATSEEATELANADVEAAAQLNKNLNDNAVKGQQMANEVNATVAANQAELAKSLAAADSQASSNDESGYLKMSESLKDFTKDWSTGDDFTYATKYYDPFAKEGERDKTIEDKEIRKDQVQAIANKINEELMKAYNTKDTEAIKHWTEEATKFKNSLATENDPKCLVPGTLITMFDGSKKPVEAIKAGDMVLTHNMFTGHLVANPVLFIEHNPAKQEKVVTLHFSDKTTISYVHEHGFFDYNKGKYIYLHSDKEAKLYIGHKFAKHINGVKGNKIKKVKLIKVTSETKVTATHSPVTKRALNIIANNLLTMPGATKPFVNFAKINKKHLCYNIRHLNKLVKRYGLFGPEDFIELPSGIFEAFNGAYLKLNIAKGIITISDIKELITRYSEYLK